MRPLAALCRMEHFRLSGKKGRLAEAGGPFRGPANREGLSAVAP